ncbi:MAG: hypothetical protein AAFO75_07615, partial [Pseudomonadota bacterium]
MLDLRIWRVATTWLLLLLLVTPTIAAERIDATSTPGFDQNATTFRVPQLIGQHAQPVAETQSIQLALNRPNRIATTPDAVAEDEKRHNRLLDAAVAP